MAEWKRLWETKLDGKRENERRRRRRGEEEHGAELRENGWSGCVRIEE